MAGVPKLVFPIVGNASYEDDFGDPRGQGSHEGNDMMAPWKSSVVAVEAGRIKIWTSSSRAGCMLYLYGKSGTTYLYIHLNNDLTKNNDNDGGCKQGVSYAPGLEDGAQVRAGELIGYVGDSGDADGIDHHLHFELHPGDGGAVSPFRSSPLGREAPLRPPGGRAGNADRCRARAPRHGRGVRCAGAGERGRRHGLRGHSEPVPAAPRARLGGGTTAASAARLTADGALLTMRVATIRVVGGLQFRVTRRVTLAVPASARLERPSGDEAQFADLVAGDKLSVTTTAVEPSLAAQRARPGELVVDRALLR